MRTFDQPYDMTQVEQTARIIFMRLASQISGAKVSEDTWAAGLAGYKDAPHMFPFVEACVDAAIEIVRRSDKGAPSR